MLFSIASGVDCLQCTVMALRLLLTLVVHGLSLLCCCSVLHTLPPSQSPAGYLRVSSRLSKYGGPFFVAPATIIPLPRRTSSVHRWS